MALKMNQVNPKIITDIVGRTTDQTRNEIIAQATRNADTQDIDHMYTQEITCPYCGAKELDSWEICPGEGDLGYIECGECLRKFSAVREVAITYVTHSLDWLQEWKRYNKKIVRRIQNTEKYLIWRARAEAEDAAKK